MTGPGKSQGKISNHQVVVVVVDLFIIIFLISTTFGNYYCGF
jgi:hypothetical protein